MDAINLLKELEFENRQATPEEQETLSHFHAVCGGPVIRRISGFQLHGFHCTGKPLGKMLGDSRIACAAS